MTAPITPREAAMLPLRLRCRVHRGYEHGLRCCLRAGHTGPHGAFTVESECTEWAWWSESTERTLAGA